LPTIPAINVGIARELVDRLLIEPHFLDQARQVSAEIASQPTPSDIVARLADVVSLQPTPAG